MSRKYLTLCLSPFIVAAASAKGIVECRVATAGIAQCNPYSSKLLVAKEVKYRKDNLKLIVDKTLPVPKKASVKVISVIDMIEKYVKIEKPIRYEGSEERHLETLKIESPKDSNDHTISEEIEIRRKAFLDNLAALQKEEYEKQLRKAKILRQIEAEEHELAQKRQTEEAAVEKVIEPLPEKVVQPKGIYKVVKGDTLSTIAIKFTIQTSELREINGLKEDSSLKIGKTLTIPLEQERLDIISKAEYVITPGDNLGSIAQDFNLSTSTILKYNDLTKKSILRIGKKLILPFPYKLAELKKKRKVLEKKRKAEARKSRMVKGFGKRKLRVTATAYSSHRGQTDKTPFLAAWNNRIRPGMKIIAVSRDMLTKYGLRNGSRVRIGGLSGYYTVRDKMNKRYRKRIDIYMGTNRRRALRWGRRSVILYY